MIKKYTLFALISFFACDAINAQSFYRRSRGSDYMISFGLGSASYEGDLVNPTLNFDLKGAVYGSYEATVQGRFNVRADLMWYRLAADDKTTDSNDSQIERNLSFRTGNLELSVMGVFNILQYSPRNRTPFATYVMAGIGGTLINPKAELNGTFHELQPLMTEGVDYSKIVLVIPVGAGVRYRVNYNWSVGAEAAYRFTNTDYLDDVSSVYVDNASFTDPIAQQLADRRPEVGEPVRPAGFQRGNPDDNDGYLIVSIKANYHLNQGLYYRRKRNKRSKIFRRR